MKTANKHLKPRLVFRRVVRTRDELWKSTKKKLETAGPVQRGCSRGFRDGPLGHIFLSRGSRGEEGPKGD